jgi:hypothetical protein
MLKVKNIDHVAIAVSDSTPAAQDFSRLSGLGQGPRPTVADLKTAFDEPRRPGARGHLVALIQPGATGGVLIELCQKSQGDPA